MNKLIFESPAPQGTTTPAEAFVNLYTNTALAQEVWLEREQAESVRSSGPGALMRIVRDTAGDFHISIVTEFAS